MARTDRLFFGILIAAAGLAGGCGEVAYKTGAGGDQLQQDRRACNEAGGEVAAYRQCMKSKGWAIADLGADPGAGDAAPPEAPASAEPDRAQERTEAPTPTLSTQAGPAQAGPAQAGSAPAGSVPATRPKLPPDPLKPVRIAGWVKFGAGGPDGAIADCVATLGPAHQPDVQNHTVTAALLTCMRTKGWRAL
jgi:hypothetical protein